MFGFDSDPSLVYSYQAKGPVENADEALSQLRLAHRYRNKLVEIELERRRRVDEVLCRLCPDLVASRAEEARLNERIESLEACVKKSRVETRARTGGTPEQRAELKQLRKDRKVCRAEIKRLRELQFESDAVQTELSQTTEWCDAERKRARADSELYWGNYLVVEQDLGGIGRGAPPKFRPWKGHGRLAVQIQGGADFDEVWQGQDGRVRLSPWDPDKWDPSRRRGQARWVRMRLRVGSQGRTPVFADWRIVMHRDIPAGCRIKWVYLVANKVGTKTKWQAQFVISRKGGFDHLKLHADSGTAVINMGWRQMGGDLRVAYVLGDDGEADELRIPAKRLSQLRKVERVQGYRDDNFNEIREALAQWRDEHSKLLPEWLAERIKHLRLWKAAAKLASVCLHWRENRFEGDAEIRALLEAWRYRDKHLYEMQANLRRHVFDWRLGYYREFAHRLALRYRRGVIEGTNLKKAYQDLPGVEDGDEATKLSRWHRKTAALSILRNVVEQRFAASERDDPAALKATKTCQQCGHVDVDLDAASTLIVECPLCHTSIDQDRRNCTNRLREALGPAKVLQLSS